MSRPINGDDVYRALSHPLRRRIIEFLQRSEVGVSELAVAHNVSIQSISQHLRVLRDARVVTQKRRGRGRVYTLHSGRLRPVTRWVQRIDQR